VAVSQFTEQEALQKAGTRIQHVVSQIQALQNTPIPWPLPPEINYAQVQILAVRVLSLKNRVQEYTRQIADALPSTGKKVLLSLGTLGLYAIGVGLKKVLGMGYQPGGVSGIEVLNQVRAYESEAAELGKQLAIIVGKKSIPGTAALPAPVPGKEEEGIMDALWSIALLGVVVGGGYMLYKWVEKQPVRRPALAQ
jgi:hypothetical protein